MRCVWSYSFRHFEIRFDVKTSEILSFFPLKDKSETIGLNFLLASISAVISSNSTNTFLFFGI